MSADREWWREQNSQEEPTWKDESHDEGICDRCGRRGTVTQVEMEAGPSPECPEGYGSLVELCERCYITYTNGLDANYEE